MSPKHGPRRTQVHFGDAAAEQLEGFNIPETIAADRAIVAIQVNPDIGDPIPDNPPFRDYREPGTSVRVVYYATALGSQVVIAYIEV
ncbi:hypothetical protein ACH4GK_32000 [Streptomyces rimosus]|uniref:hypothetical protein n=1 Tax=Streptomyces rimosus TaxID=1927 RepID=UPI0004CC466E|nr:hypothetical protein [Streptomyces rimosus]